MSEDEKQDREPKETFLNTAARAVGSTLGKLAAKTGLAHPGERTVPPPARRMPGKKKADAKVVRKAGAKKKAVSKKTTRVTPKSKG